MLLPVRRNLAVSSASSEAGRNSVVPGQRGVKLNGRMNPDITFLQRTGELNFPVVACPLRTPHRSRRTRVLKIIGAAVKLDHADESQLSLQNWQGRSPHCCWHLTKKNPAVEAGSKRYLGDYAP
jgi:hypothetical protein